MKKGGNPKNLKPFKKGEDPRRNTTGLNRKLPELDELMADVLGEEKEGIPAAKAILMALRAKAAKGDIRAAEVLLNRGYGLPKQTVNTNITGLIINWQEEIHEDIPKTMESPTEASGPENQ